MIALFLSALMSQGMAMQKCHHYNSDGVKGCLGWKPVETITRHRQFTNIRNRTSAELGLAPDQIQNKSGRKPITTINAEVENAQKKLDIALRYAGQPSTKKMTFQERIDQGIFPTRRITSQQKSHGVMGALSGWPKVTKTQREIGKIVTLSIPQQAPVSGKRQFPQHSNQETLKGIFG